MISVKYNRKMSDVGLDKREIASAVYVRVLVSTHLLCCERPRGMRCIMRETAVSKDRDKRASTKRPGALPLLQSRPFGVYLTLRVVSSLDQQSVEGKEGRDEEEVTSALLPIWKGKEKHTRENTTQTNPDRLPWLLEENSSV